MKTLLVYVVSCVVLFSVAAVYGQLNHADLTVRWTAWQVQSLIYTDIIGAILGVALGWIHVTKNRYVRVILTWMVVCAVAVGALIYNSVGENDPAFSFMVILIGGFGGGVVGAVLGMINIGVMIERKRTKTAMNPNGQALRPPE